MGQGRQQLNSALRLTGVEAKKPMSGVGDKGGVFFIERLAEAGVTSLTWLVT